MGPEGSPRQPSLRARGPARAAFWRCSGLAPTRRAQLPARRGSQAARTLQSRLNAADSQCWWCPGHPMGI